MRSGHFRPQSGQESQRTKYFFGSKPSNWWSHRCHFAFPWGNRPSNVYKSCQNKPFIAFTRIWYTGRIRKELLLKSTIIGVPTALTPYPFPSLFFLLTSFSVCSLHGPHKINMINATGPDEFFTCATRLEGKCKFSYRLGYGSVQVFGRSKKFCKRGLSC